MTTQTSAAPTLRLAVLPRSGLLTNALLVAGGAGLIWATAQVAFKLPFTPVPITGQTFSVLLVGAALGTVLGGASSSLYVLWGLVAPSIGVHAQIYAPHTGHGWATITSASGGYLVSYPFVSALTGRLAEQRWDRRFSSAVGAMLTGNVVIYLFGLPWLAVVLNTNLEKTLELGLYPFVPGDTFKLYLAALALPGAWKLVGAAKRRTDR
jgi:biotin transport system substrate-specific component